MRKLLPGLTWGIALFGVALFVETFVERAEENRRKHGGGSGKNML